MFAAENCSLALAGRNEANLASVKQECTKLGDPSKEIEIFMGDATDEEFLKRLVAGVLTRFGRLDILVNAAGVLGSGAVESSSMDDYDRIMNINTRSIVNLTRLCIPHLKKTKGTIVNLSSIAGPCSFPNVAYYCMSKAAIDQFTKCLALELAPDGVRVNAVCPGVIVTDIHKRGGMNEEQYKKFLEHSKTTHALGRVGSVDEVANAILFLASDRASFTTGELFRVDGGRGIMTPR